MLNIVQFIHTLDMGGAETLVKEYALGINKDKFNLTVLCFYNLHSSYDVLLARKKINVIYVCEYMLFYGRKDIFSRCINLLQKYYFTRKFLRKLKPDIVHIHLPLNRYVKFAQLPKTTKIFYTQHFDMKRLEKYSRDTSALNWLIKNYKTQLIALNDNMKNQLNKLFNITNTVVLNNGINLARFQHRKTKGQIRKELNIPQDAFVIGHVGRFVPVKNHIFLIDVAEQILKQKNNVWLLFTGNNNYYLQKIIKKIKKIGMEKKATILHDRTDIPDILSAMDVFVFPSISEGLGISVIEAQIVGLPCIVSNAVPKATEISNLITYKSLKESIDKWTEAILKTPPQPIYKNLKDWDISIVIKKLENLYE